MFGREVADVAMSYVIALARETFLVDREVRAGKWPKPRGISLSGKTMGLVGFGDIGKATAKGALELLRAGSTDVVLVDLLLPEGDGHDLLRRIRRDLH